jgi:hypothetical protein
MTDTDLKRAKVFLDWWFSPWGASKTAIWEHLYGDSAITPTKAVGLLHAILKRFEPTTRKIDETFAEELKEL